MFRIDQLNVPAIDTFSLYSIGFPIKCMCALLGWGAPLLYVQVTVQRSDVAHGEPKGKA